MYNFLGQPGLQVPFNESNAKILDYFKLFATTEFYQLISDRTKLYPGQHFQAHLNDTSRSLWTPTTATDIQHISALHLLTKIIQKHQVLQYWSTDALLQTKVFSQIVPRNRFQIILQFLHVPDDTNYDATNPSSNKSLELLQSSYLIDSKLCTPPPRTFQ